MAEATRQRGEWLDDADMALLARQGAAEAALGGDSGAIRPPTMRDHCPTGIEARNGSLDNLPGCEAIEAELGYPTPQTPALPEPEPEPEPEPTRKPTPAPRLHYAPDGDYTFLSTFGGRTAELPLR